MEMLECGVKARDRDRYLRMIVCQKDYRRQVAIARKHTHRVTLTHIYT